MAAWSTFVITGTSSTRHCKSHINIGKHIICRLCSLLFLRPLLPLAFLFKVVAKTEIIKKWSVFCRDDITLRDKNPNIVTTDTFYINLKYIFSPFATCPRGIAPPIGQKQRNYPWIGRFQFRRGEFSWKNHADHTTAGRSKLNWWSCIYSLFNRVYFSY